MDLRPTESNLTERETGTESEVQIDPVGDDDEQAGPSSSLSRSTQSAPPPPLPPPESESQAAHPDEQAISSSPTMPLAASPQASGIPRRARRRREGAGSVTRTQVDRGVLDYLSSVTRDDGEEAYGRSLAQYLRAIPREFRLRTRGAIQIVLDASTPPNNPRPVFSFLERWQLTNDNPIESHVSHQVQGESASHPPQAPPPTQARMPTPPPQLAPLTNVPHQGQYMGHSAHAQYGHLNIPNVVGWPQHGYGRHGHIGGYSQFGQPYTQDNPQHLQNLQYQNPQLDPGRFQQNPGLSATTHADTDVGQQPRQATQSGPPPSPPPTYHHL
ncbi:uncharacterized protein [Ranitomeya imitator]|uniref:uncharacterized protein n=1 Tax=Ranitomeya imitator TaxID=111125 RepID=UPI0037E874AC